ncbi:Adenylate cyclase type 9 [Trichinella nelsoni]|uniref:Adenylate cyclase type 9 n=1 Tax=Trichinella nelsoni TaxID=6336 RepID=A0A0V0RV16_9BILA|nr:Adenylate cyclase type 9 [Trichinella nelsoni]
MDLDTPPKPTPRLSKLKKPDTAHAVQKSNQDLDNAGLARVDTADQVDEVVQKTEMDNALNELCTSIDALDSNETSYRDAQSVGSDNSLWNSVSWSSGGESEPIEDRLNSIGNNNAESVGNGDTASNQPHSPLLTLNANVCFVGWIGGKKGRATTMTKMWAVLKNKKLSFFVDDTCEKLIDCLPCNKILLVSKQHSSESAVEPVLILHYMHPRRKKIKFRRFVVEDENDLTAWITLLGKSIIGDVMGGMDGVFDTVGKVYIKHGTTRIWTCADLVKRNYSLYYATEGIDCFFEVDFRKVYSIRDMAEKHECCADVKEKGPCFALLMENDTLWIQADSKAITSAWRAVVQSMINKQSNVLSEQRLSSDNVPMIVEKCINFISVYGLETEGIHRMCGTVSKIDDLYSKLIVDPFSTHLLPHEHSVHTVTSVLRKFFASVDEPLVPKNITINLLNHINDTVEWKCRLRYYDEAIRQLGRINYSTLRKLVGHLKEVTQFSETNKMNVQNLACIFSPTIFRMNQIDDDKDKISFQYSVKLFTVMADLIENYEILFNISEEENRRDSLVQKAKKKLISPTETPKKVSSGILHCLHVLEKDRISFNIKVGVDLTAENVCEYVRSRGVASLPSQIALFEVICDGQLERLVPSDESVFDIVMRWISWPLGDRVGNYLIVKGDSISSKLNDYATKFTSSSPWSTAYVSVTKSFAKRYLALFPNELMLFRNQKDDNAEQVWRISDFLWFIGAEAKRHPPAKFNVTFIRNCEFLTRSKTLPFMGVALSFKQESDQLRLLSAVYSENPLISVSNCYLVEHLLEIFQIRAERLLYKLRLSVIEVKICVFQAVAGCGNRRMYARRWSVGRSIRQFLACFFSIGAERRRFARPTSSSKQLITQQLRFCKRRFAVFVVHVVDVVVELVVGTATAVMRARQKKLPFSASSRSAVAVAVKLMMQREQSTGVTYDASMPMISDKLTCPFETPEVLEPREEQAGRRRWWAWLGNATSKCWRPEFSSRVLESQYWQCVFPQFQRRFRAGLLYTIIYALMWLVYFASLHPLGEIYPYVLFSVVYLVTFSLIFAFTFTKSLYNGLYVSTSVLCVCLLAVASAFVFIADKPSLGPLAKFALSVELVLLIYTVIPVPMYLCLLMAVVFSVMYEELCAGAYKPVTIVLHGLAHLLGAHIYTLTQVRDRKTFIKLGQSLLARHDLEIEKEFKDRMIRSVMPQTVAEELLKESSELKRPSNTPSSDRCTNLFRPFTMNLMRDVSILFADIVGFTTMSSNKSADELVNMLNDLFGRFDALCGQSGCEKISTLGDCYYCVSGCPEPRADHAQCCVKMGLAMIEAIHQFDIDRNQEVNMRVGIHTGTVLCGIVGRRRFKFDVFSNDVDLANAMESTGMSGRVHVSEATAAFLDDQYTLEPAPDYKGIKTYFIVNNVDQEPPPPPAAAADVPASQDVPSPPPPSSISNTHIHDRLRSSELRHIDSSDMAISDAAVNSKKYLNKTLSVSNLTSSERCKSDSIFPPGVALNQRTKWASASLVEPSKTASVTTGGEQVPLEKLSENTEPEPRRSSRVVTFDSDRNAEFVSGVDGVESSIDHVLSTHTASISRFEADHVDFDHRLADAIRGSSLARGDYLVRRKALTRTLNFIDPAVEQQYRAHFELGARRSVGEQEAQTDNPEHQEPATTAATAAATDPLAVKVARLDDWRVDPPKFSVVMDLVVSTIVFWTLLLICMLAVNDQWWYNAAFVTYATLSGSFVLALAAWTLRCVLSRATLPSIWVRWWPKHALSLTMINLPLGALLASVHCPAAGFSFAQPRYWQSESLLLLFCLLVLMVMFGHVNYSQIRSWPKSLFCCLIGIGLVTMVHLCASNCQPSHTAAVGLVNSTVVFYNATVNGQDDGGGGGGGVVPLIPDHHHQQHDVQQQHHHHQQQQQQLEHEHEKEKLFVQSDHQQYSCCRNEIYMVVLLACLLVIYLNYQFEASFRMSFYGDLQACETIRRMKEMKDQADWLLSNIIPHHVVEHLAKTSKYSENHAMVAVLFASVVNWNDMYEETYEGGREFLRVLNELVSDFDELLDRPEFTQVEKIKTIGPTYMAASGLNPARRRLSMHPYSHLYELMEFALALQETLDNFNKDLLSFEFRMKIGFNIGPVTAGVIGTTKLYYDIWGDTVNIGSRMYSTGVVGRIQVSRQAKERLDTVYEFEFRDHISVKGVDGGMDVYLLKSRKQKPPSLLLADAAAGAASSEDGDDGHHHHQQQQQQQQHHHQASITCDGHIH